MGRVRCAVVPAGDHGPLEDAVRDGGGELVDADEAEAIVWLDPSRTDELRALLDRRPEIRWVQLPSAGIEPYVDVLDDDRRWTCAKGVYAQTVAELALALALGGMRRIIDYAARTSWSEAGGVNLVGAHVTIVGGGEIAQELVKMLRPFDATITVVRNRQLPIEGTEVIGVDRLHESLGRADLVVLALALTPTTEGIIDAKALAAMQPHAWLVNVARGRHVDTDALVAALQEGRIGGAGLDVTEPEPLPDGHPLWSLPNVAITPHVGSIPATGERLLAERVRVNVERFAAGEELLGPVYVELGY